ncbi:MAG: FecR family protein, partial [Candidatus Eremiobacteraeota bacterium]|nr:FecR family protein [Candidatus Eremiobacteraeota bacterium]
MLHFPQTTRMLLAVGLMALLVPQSALGAQDKELQRDRGSVSYQDASGASHPVSGKIVLADDVLALTGRASAASLNLPDSSVVALGENTRVRVGAFNTGQNGPGSTIRVEGGALKFAIKHPGGSRSNYTFQTPTSQIAVRGTEGFLVVGPQGTQLVCT